MVDYGIGLDRVSAHEALHHFFGWHGDDASADEGIMDGPTLMTAQTVQLTDRQIRVVQAKHHPE